MNLEMLFFQAVGVLGGVVAFSLVMAASIGVIMFMLALWPLIIAAILFCINPIAGTIWIAGCLIARAITVNRNN